MEQRYAPWDNGAAKAKQAIRKQAGRNSALLFGTFALTLLLARLSVIPIAYLAGFCELRAVLILQTLSAQLPFYVAAFILFKVGQRNNGFKVRDFLQKPQLPTGEIIALMVITIGCSYAVNIATAYIEQICQSVFQFTISEPSTVSIEDPVAMAIQLLSLCLITPMIEELLFRGAILGDTLPYGTAFAVIISALSFGLYHMSAAIPFAAVMGLFSGYLTVRCRSLLPSIGVHMIINLCSLLSNTSVQYLLQAEENSVGYLIAGCCAVLLQLVIYISIPAAAILAVVLRKKLFHPLPDGCPVLTGGQKQRAYWCHPASILFLLLVAGVILLSIYMA